LYYASGDRPLPPNIAQAEATAHGKTNRRTTVHELQSGMADMARIGTAIAEAEISSRATEYQGALVPISPESRQVTETEITRVAQQVNQQGIQIAEIMQQTQSAAFNLLGMAERFGRRSQEDRMVLMQRVMNELSRIQKGQHDPMVEVYEEMLEHANLERAKMALLAAKERQIAEGRNAEERQRMANQLQDSHERESEMAHAAMEGIHNAGARANEGLRHVVNSLIDQHTQPHHRPLWPERPSERVRPLGQTKDAEMQDPRAETSLPPEDPEPEGTITITVPGGGGGMGMLLLAGAALVAVAFANS